MMFGCIFRRKKKGYISRKRLSVYEKQLEQYKESIKILEEENGLLTCKVNDINAQNVFLDERMGNFGKFLKNNEGIAKVILESKLNCASLNDEEERKYIKSIIEFIYTAYKKN